MSLPTKQVWTSCIPWAAFGFLCGVLLHATRPFEPAPWWALGGLALLAWSASGLPVRQGKMIGVALLFVVVGVWRFDLTLPTSNETAYASDERVELVGRIVDVRNYDAILSVQETDGLAVHLRSRVSFTGGRNIGIGERLRVACVLTKLDPTSPRAAYDARQGIFLRCKGAPDVTRLNGPTAWDVRAALFRWRAVITRRIRSTMPGDEGELLAGILYGERGLSKAASDSFRNAGMTHLIAVSGSNITIVVSVLVPLFLALGYRRKSAIIMSGVGILTFVLFVGAAASVVRAALMGWFALLARVVGRKPDALRLLVIAATIIVAFDPWALAFDAGFALSFLATIGLLLLSKPLSDVLKWIPETFGLREVIATTIAATLATTPYSLWAFQKTSLAGLVTNVFAVPLVGLTMMWGAIAAALGPIIHAAALPAWGCLSVMLGIASLSDRAPWLRVTFSLPTWGMFSTYGLFFLIWKLRVARKSAYPQPTESRRHFLSSELRVIDP